MPVLYVSGVMRSGTTVLAQTLASAPNALLLGEVKPILLDPANHSSCDCGDSAETCRFWSRVSGSGGHDDVVEHANAYSFKAIARTLLTAARNRHEPDLGLKVASVLKRVQDVDRTKVLVDSSKTPMGILLWRLAGVRPHIVHIVRDPRTVAKLQSQPSAVSKLKSESAFHTWLIWLWYTSLSYLLGKSPLAASYTPVSYGSFVRSPSKTIDRVRTSSGIHIPTPTDNTVVVTESHMRAGNPRRKTQLVRIAPT